MILTGGGLTTLTWALTMLYKTYVFYRHSVVTAGKIVETEYVNHNGRRGYAAIVEFTIKNKKSTGKSVRFRATELKKQSAHRIGAEVFVRYVPQNPALAKIKSFAEIWLEPLAGILLGSAFAATGLFLLGKL